MVAFEKLNPSVFQFLLHRLRVETAKHDPSKKLEVGEIDSEEERLENTEKLFIADLKQSLVEENIRELD